MAPERGVHRNIPEQRLDYVDAVHGTKAPLAVSVYSRRGWNPFSPQQPGASLPRQPAVCACATPPPPPSSFFPAFTPSWETIRGTRVHAARELWKHRKVGARAGAALGGRRRWVGAAGRQASMAPAELKGRRARASPSKPRERGLSGSRGPQASSPQLQVAGARVAVAGEECACVTCTVDLWGGGGTARKSACACATSARPGRSAA